MALPVQRRISSNFYPRSPCGERLMPSCKAISLSRFLSTLSLRRATASFNAAQPATQNFYPRSPCGERRRNTPDDFCSRGISIHALLAESDFFRSLEGHKTQISIHALLAESDVIRNFANSLALQFLSTLSLRRATVSKRRLPSSRRHFYPRSPCGERPMMPANRLAIEYFYPRSPCGERR